MTIDLLIDSLKTSVFSRMASYEREFFYFHVTNQTNAGGSFEFPVANPLCFHDLQLLARYEDLSVVPLLLFDMDGETCSSLDPEVLYLDSEPVAQTHPEHGAIVSAMLTGTLNRNKLHLQWFNQGISAVVEVTPTFSSPLVNPDCHSSRIIRVFDNEGMFYSIGTIGVVEIDPVFLI